LRLRRRPRAQAIAALYACSSSSAKAHEATDARETQDHHCAVSDDPDDGCGHRSWHLASGNLPQHWDLHDK
jgi:hypothetical protein